MATIALRADESLPLTATLLASIDNETCGPSQKHDCCDDEVSTDCSSSRDQCWTKDRVLKLCEELSEGFNAPEFQQELKKLLEKAPNNRQVPGRMQLALTVQQQVLPKYGFSGSLAGVEAMRETICPFMVDWMVKKLIDDIDRALGLPVDATLQASQGPLSTRETTPKSASESEQLSFSMPEDRSSPVESWDSLLSLGSMRCSSRQGKSLTRVQVVGLLEDLVKAFGSDDVQQDLNKAGAKSPCNWAVVKRVMAEILPQHEMPGSVTGVMLIFDAIAPFIDDKEVKSLVSELDGMLGLPNGATANFCRGDVASDAPMQTSEFTRAQALSLCNELLVGFSTAEFQQSLQVATKGSKDPRNVHKRAALALTVQSKVLPKYGLQGTTAGVLVMLDRMVPFVGDWLVGDLINRIDDALGLPSETTLRSIAARADALG